MINWPIPHENNKYAKWYNILIDNALKRNWSKTSNNGYVESHHIIPRSFGGVNNKSNIVCLTAREHYIAHALLWKMRFSGKYGSKMAYAFNTFIRKFKTDDRIEVKVNSRVYESFRKYYAEMLKKENSGSNNHFYGRKHSEETKRIIGEKSKLKEFKRGADHPSYGKKLNISDEGKQRRLDGLKIFFNDKKKVAEWIEKGKQTRLTPESIEKNKKIYELRKGVARNPAHIEKMQIAVANRKGKTWNEIYTPEQIERMRIAAKNKVYSPEGKARAVAAAKIASLGIKRKKIKCPYCDKQVANNIFVRFHGTKCKQYK